MAEREPCSSPEYLCTRGLPKVPVHFTPAPLASKSLLFVEELSSSKVERTELKYLRLIVVCLLGMLTYYLVFNFLLSLFKSYIACYYISNWQVKISNFGHGPAPSWLNTFPNSSRGSPQGSDEYVNFTFALSVTDNPSWLRVNLRYIRLYYGLGDIICLENPGITFSGQYNVTLHPRLHFSNINEIGNPCLDYLLFTGDSIPLSVELEVEPYILGHYVGLLRTDSLVYLGMLGRNSTLPREMANTCRNIYLKQVTWLSSLNRRLLRTQVDEEEKAYGNRATYPVRFSQHTS